MMMMEKNLIIFIVRTMKNEKKTDVISCIENRWNFVCCVEVGLLYQIQVFIKSDTADDEHEEEFDNQYLG